jgi:hypothetical protein
MASPKPVEDSPAVSWPARDLKLVEKARQLCGGDSGPPIGHRDDDEQVDESIGTVHGIEWPKPIGPRAGRDLIPRYDGIVALTLGEIWCG